MAVAAHSALYHLKTNTPVEFHLLSDNISDNNRTRITNVLKRQRSDVPVFWHDPDIENIFKINVRHYSKASLFRLILPQIIDDDRFPILYIDSDLIVEADIDDLLSANDGQYIVYAARNGADQEFDRFVRKKFPELYAPENNQYFNSGVLMINPKHWNAARITEQTLDFLHNNSEKLSFPDQDALNAVLAGRWGPLPMRWNKQINRIGQPEAAPLSEAGILHYTSYKPWNPNYTWRASFVFHKAYLRSRWDSPLVSAARTAQLVIRQMSKRIRNKVSRTFGS